MRHAALILCLAASTAAAVPPAGVVNAETLLAGTAGKWRGELQYRDYQSNSWQGLPMTVVIALQPDSVTTVRTAQFDDGPQTGLVTITTTSLVDAAAATIGYGAYRKGRAVDQGLARIEKVTGNGDAEQWTIVTLEQRKDGDAMAAVRETITRDGTTLTTLKEVNPVDDRSDAWLPRNRTVLRRIAN